MKDLPRKLEALIDDVDEDDLNSMEIFRAVYVDAELVLQIMCDAATSISVLGLYQ